MPSEAPGTQAAAKQPDSNSTFILDLGVRRRRHVRRLKNGQGPLMARVVDTLELLKEEHEIADNVQLVMVVVEREDELFGIDDDDDDDDWEDNDDWD